MQVLLEIPGSRSSELVNWKIQGDVLAIPPGPTDLPIVPFFDLARKRSRQINVARRVHVLRELCDF